MFVEQIRHYCSIGELITNLPSDALIGNSGCRPNDKNRTGGVDGAQAEAGGCGG